MGLLLTKEVEVELRGANYKYYSDLGYDIPKVKNKKGTYTTPNRTKIKVKIEDLQKGSGVKVQVLCDICSINISEKVYYDYVNSNEKCVIHKDCCDDPKCIGAKTVEIIMFKYGKNSSMQVDEFKQKAAETNYLKYGVKNPLQNELIKDKAKQTRINKYGVEHMLQLEECREKFKNTMQERYGVDNYTQTEEYKEKTKLTCIDKYGVENPLQSPEIREKVKQTNLDRYGFEWAQQNPDIKLKGLTTLYKNNNQKASNQQKYIFNLLSYKQLLSECEINFLVSRMFLDIAFPKEKIYVEYDGGFHNGKVLCNQMTQEEFDLKEFKRSCYLGDLGWKEIRIISISDLIPSDNKIIEMIKFAIDYINSGHRWMIFDIDNKVVKCSQFEEKYDYGILRKIKDKDLKEVG